MVIVTVDAAGCEKVRIAENLNLFNQKLRRISPLQKNANPTFINNLKYILELVNLEFVKKCIEAKINCN